MQLREVGKLAMYLRKMWWLQRPSHGAQSGSVFVQWIQPPWFAAGPSGPVAQGSKVDPASIAPLWLGPLLLVGSGHPCDCPSGSDGTVAVQGNLTV